jgi:hypothetical protein
MNDGLCMCGCGQPTKLARQSSTRRGWVKGQPVKYLQGHGPKKTRPVELLTEVKLCACGCGQPTPIATRTDTNKGIIKGQPRRFVRGHQTNRVYTSLEDGFWQNVTRGGEGECWEWRGYIASSGYGQLAFHDVTYQAHRVSYQIHYGSLDAGLHVCHRCDNPPCVNPKHLFAGTPSANSADMVSKRRHAHGERNGQAKLTEKQVQIIRSDLANGASYNELARRFNVTSALISMIALRKVWKYVE